MHISLRTTVNGLLALILSLILWTRSYVWRWFVYCYVLVITRLKPTVTLLHNIFTELLYRTTSLYLVYSLQNFCLPRILPFCIILVVKYECICALASLFGLQVGEGPHNIPVGEAKLVPTDSASNLDTVRNIDASQLNLKYCFMAALTLAIAALTAFVFQRPQCQCWWCWWYQTHQQTSCALSKWTALNGSSLFATFCQGCFSLLFLFLFSCFVFAVPCTQLVFAVSLFPLVFFKVVS